MFKSYFFKLKEFTIEHLVSPIRLRWKKVRMGFFKQFKPYKKQEAFVYVALGDSTVEGTGASAKERAYPSVIFQALRLHYPKSEFYNLGKGYSKISDIINSQIDEAIKINPSLITISIGANDVANHTRLSDFEKNLEEILNRLKNETSAEIVINSIPDLTATKMFNRFQKVYGNYRIGLFNSIIEKSAQKHQILFVDLYLQSKIFANSYPEMISSDGIHPSDAGYALWANTILSTIQSQLFRN